ncbi:HEAT repeat domain-containing protein [Bacillus sp. BRMEA1]|uniref:HEAT repeat domain-containing protein n=1 Tax=Neobacillus endophyticus TaxID=2738405 RepID=UPI00156664A8|nr:HEAT repeat domain-containing protein [Neobacillus endophyticus]NRD78258.1 HEAT repeat domain-containing protein [Neobacillus endophyticus]
MLKKQLFLLAFLIISFVVLLIIILGYLMVRKAIASMKRKQIQHYKEEYHPLLMKMITEPASPRDLVLDSLTKQKAVEELLSKYTQVLEGEDERRHLSEIAQSALGQYYQKRLHDKRWSIRMNTLYHIEDFKMIQLEEDVYNRTKTDLSREEHFHALRILALFQFEKIFELLTERYGYLTEIELRNILFRLETQHFEQFVQNYHESNPTLQKAVLDVISIKRETDYLPFLEQIFPLSSGEIRLRVLKALANIGYVEDIDTYMELLYSPKWEERMLAAKLIGTLREEKALPRLVELLQDSSWWVRSQAGESISHFVKGKQILMEVLQTSTDSFARDMAWEWLHKGG